MKKLLILLILSLFSIQGYAGSCPDGSEPVGSVSADGTYFVYNCGGQSSSSSVTNSGEKVMSVVPQFIGGDTVKNICKNVPCDKSVDDYYMTYYLPKKFHKAFAIIYKKTNGKYEISWSTMLYQYENTAEAKREVLKACKKDTYPGETCSILFVNNKIDNKELYKALVSKPIPANAYASGSTWICNKNYYRNNTKTACLKVPANSTSSHNSNLFKCNKGYTKTGNSCIKSSSTKTTTTSTENSYDIWSSESLCHKLRQTPTHEGYLGELKIRGAKCKTSTTSGEFAWECATGYVQIDYDEDSMNSALGKKNSCRKRTSADIPERN